jgi:pimeloyl-ACP methyl ester carboxylesterase
MDSFEGIDPATTGTVLVDGRAVEFATLGDPAHPTVVLHHGTPGCALMLGFFAGLLEHADLFLVMASRPGYGTSERRVDRRVADVVDDVRAVLDQLGRESYVTAGWSGGGPHALACAALDAPRCTGAISLAGVAPADVDFDWTEGMGQSNVEEFEIARKGGPAFEAMMAEAAEASRAATAETVAELFGDLLSTPDQAFVAQPTVADALAATMRHAFQGGWEGFHDDDRAILSAWGFEPAAVEVPVEVWFGDEDLMVPPSHGRWLLDAIGGSSAFHRAAEGHFTIVSAHLDELAARLVART